MNPRGPGRRAGDDVLDPSLVGVLPVISPADSTDRQPRNNAATAATAAGVRAFTAQAIAFYFRAPAKAFFRMRVDYLAYARNLQQQNHSYLPNNLAGTAANSGGHGSGQVARQTWWQWCRSVVSRTTPGVLVSAVRHSGWRVIPDQVLPPLIANVSVGAVLYTSYLQILGHLHEDSGKATKRVYPSPTARSQQRQGPAPEHVVFQLCQASRDRHGGIFAGWSLSLAKDSLGSAVFFSSFEYVKAQSYYSFIAWYYGQDRDAHHAKTIQPHYSIEPAFLMLAGISASFAQQVVLHPLTHVQMEHWEHLEYLDAQARKIRKHTQSNAPKSKWRWKMIHAYYHAYRETWAQCVAQARAQEGSGSGALRRWLYRGFWWSTIRQVPSTSAGLIIFELVRRKYGLGGEPVRINKDGYDILLA
ncbi:hypothetical protein OPQ81_008094 [Rhizoctonia solani]|nr:hypothetical protein OPQ81_008094 [Rhizoctonia solani]